MTLLANPWMIEMRNRVRKFAIVRRFYSSWISHKAYEETFGQQFVGSVSRDSVVWDVGANLGLYSRRAIEKGARHLVCVEPAPEAIDALRNEFQSENSAATRVTILPLALSDVNGTAKFAADGASATNRLVSGDVAEPTATEVRVARADDLVARDHVPAPNVVKIDVEGYELEVLRGFGSLLRSPSLFAVFVEIHFGLLHDRGLDSAPKEIEKLLAEAGFAVRWLDLSHICGLRSGAGSIQ